MKALLVAHSDTEFQTAVRNLLELPRNLTPVSKPAKRIRRPTGSQRDTCRRTGGTHRLGP